MHIYAFVFSNSAMLALNVRSSLRAIVPVTTLTPNPERKDRQAFGALAIRSLS
jgi:hypothetical protein